MRRQFLLISLSVWLFLLGGNLLAQPGECEVSPTLFADDGLRGQPFSLNNSVNDLHSVGFGDSASSICVPAGWRVILYVDSGYRGDTLEITGPAVIYDLKRDRPQGADWGDRISSAEVTRIRRSGNADCDRYPVLYGDDGFSGSRYEVRDSVANLHREGAGDQASSVCVPNGWRIVLYENSNYGGASLTIDGYQAINDLKRDRPGGNDWGDKISSVRVERAGNSGGRGRGRGRNPNYPPPPPPPPRSSDPGRDNSNINCTTPTFFVDSNYRGRSLVVESSINDLHARGFGDSISSACIPSGWTLTLYSDNNFRGDRLVLNGNQALADLDYGMPDSRSWGDRVSSIEVSPSGRFNPLPGIRLPGDPGNNTARCSVPVLYSNDSFSGRTIEVTQSIPDLHSRNFGDDASSVCVPQGWQIILYSETNYRGSSLVVNGQEIQDLRQNRPNGQDWGDIVSSVQVTRRR